MNDDFDASASLAEPKPSGATRRRGWRYWLGGGLIVLVLALWFNPIVGYRSERLTSASLSYSHSFGYGSGTVFAWEGQTIHMTCDTEVTAGHLMVRVVPGMFPHGIDQDLQVLHIRQTGKVEFDVKAPKTGLYRVRISAWPDGQGYDVTYSASWCVR